ncbi:hypothetical protein ACWEOZ_30910 [Actinoplanes sp. NPDC004185]
MNLGKRSLTIAASLLCGAAILSPAVPATATPADGAQTYHENYCQDFGFGTFCVQAHGVYNVTTTPSGNYNFTDNRRYEYVWDFQSGDHYESDSKAHYRALWKADAPQVIHQRVRETAISPGSTCTYEYDYHCANGTVHFYNWNVTCS